jgi:putative flippase GtrA
MSFPEPVPTSSNASWLQTARREIRRFLKFLVVGGAAFVVDTGSLSALVFGFGVKRVLAKGIAFSLAVFASYLGNRYWVYRETRPTSGVAQGAQFFVVSLAGLVINLLVFAWVDRAFASLIDARLRLYVAQCGAVGTALVWNFLVNRFVTYRDVRIGH